MAEMHCVWCEAMNQLSGAIARRTDKDMVMLAKGDADMAYKNAKPGKPGGKKKPPKPPKPKKG